MKLLPQEIPAVLKIFQGLADLIPAAPPPRRPAPAAAPPPPPPGPLNSQSSG